MECRLRPQIETTSKAEYSGLMTHYEEYMSRKGRRSRERKKRINERVQGVISCTKHRSTHLPGSTLSRITEVCDTLKTLDAVK